MSKRYCPQGHDTWIVGRKAHHRCRECARIYDRKYSRSNWYRIGYLDQLNRRAEKRKAIGYF